MSTARSLAAIPAVSVVAAIGVLALVPASARPATLDLLNETVKVMGFAGMLIAALAFAPGDYLRRGWGLSAACYAMLLVRDAWILLQPGPEGLAQAVGRSLLVLLANGCVVLGAWTLARAWKVAGLEHPVSKGAQRAVLGAAIAASVVFAGPATAYDFVRMIHGQWAGAWNLASDLGDVLALPVIAPVALTAMAVSGGSLRWPWLLFAVSLFAWLLYDAVLVVPVLLRIDDTPFLPASEVVRVLAGTSAFAAGLAQRRAVREIDGA